MLRYGLYVLYNEHTGQPVDKWIRAFDVDAFGGRGDVTFTSDPRRALAFGDRAQALKAWQTQSTVRPVRPDGQPNRPITSFTVEVCALLDEPRPAPVVDDLRSK